jgi:hypothetical protein
MTAPSRRPPRSEEDSVHALVQLCDRLPLALRIVAAKLAARPHWRVGQMVHRGGRRETAEGLVGTDPGFRRWGH